ncbi:MAG: transcriptional repressor [Spirochaetales bacterium]|nr:transcriptional repressor [Spirochaetales bacterium]
MEKDKNFKRSRQRDKILALLRSTASHPTADWLYGRLKDEFPHLSLGTVYRNLNILIRQGLVKKIDFGSTFDRFDANIDRHYHFVCERCGTVIDLAIPFDEGLNERVASVTPFTVTRHRIEFYGMCDQCKEKE